MGRIKLIDKTLRIYIICSVAVLFITAPIFYFAIEHLYITDTDESLELFKKEFEHYYLPKIKQSDIKNWNAYNRDMKIAPFDSKIRKDTFFYQNFIDELENENEPYRVLKSVVHIENKPYTFVVRISLVESEDLIERIAILFVMVIAILLMLLLAITNRLSKKVWSPFRNILEQLKRFELSNGQKIIVQPTNITEFDELNTAIQKLIERNLNVYNQQKIFIENASHELQTPLAVLKSKLNLLLQSENLSKEHMVLLEAIDLPLTRLTRINKNLLLLAKIENNQYTHLETINPKKIFNEVSELLSDYIVQKKILLTQEFSPDFTINTNLFLFEILIHNLLINAIIHNQDEGLLKVKLTPHSFMIANSGLHSLDTPNLFQRFKVATENKSNSGLGLSIVKEICLRLDWSITYLFENDLHHFYVFFHPNTKIQN